MKKVAILSPALSQPRFHRRAQLFLDNGFQVRVYSFTRDYYAENTFPEGVEVVDLGKISGGNYLRRVPTLAQAIFKIRGKEKSGESPPDLAYAFGLDMALVAGFSIRKSVPLVYETGDLQNPLPHGSLKSRALAAADKFAVGRARLLAATSPRFIEEYFEIIAPGVTSRAVLVENQVSRDTARRFPRVLQAKEPGLPVRIGFVGRLRYPECLVPLMEAVGQESEKFQLHVHGDGPLRETVERYAKLHDNILFHGSFRNPDDLENIYRSIDVNYVVYDNRDPNVRLALPNKLYESPYFGTPMIVAARTHLSERVAADGIGLATDPAEAGFAPRLLRQLTPGMVADLSRRTLDIPTSELVENHDDLKRRLEELLG